MPLLRARPGAGARRPTAKPAPRAKAPAPTSPVSPIGLPYGGDAQQPSGLGRVLDKPSTVPTGPSGVMTPIDPSMFPTDPLAAPGSPMYPTDSGMVPSPDSGLMNVMDPMNANRKRANGGAF